MAGKKVCLQGNIPAGKYSRGFRKNNKNSRVFPHKNISLYSIIVFFIDRLCRLLSIFRPGQDAKLIVFFFFSKLIKKNIKKKQKKE